MLAGVVLGFAGIAGFNIAQILAATYLMAHGGPVIESYDYPGRFVMAVMALETFGFGACLLYLSGSRAKARLHPMTRTLIVSAMGAALIGMGFFDYQWAQMLYGSPEGFQGF